MIEVKLQNGSVLQQAETEQEWLEIQPEARLRELFAGDVDGMQRFHDRLRDLDARYTEWLRLQPSRIFWRKNWWLIYVLAWLRIGSLREVREALS